MVVLESQGGGIIGQGQTDAMGRATFHPHGQGTYVVTIEQPGYESMSEHVDLTTNPTAYVTLTLKAVRDTESSVPPEGPTAGIAAVPPDAMKEFDKGQQLLKEKHDAEGSIKHFRRATELYNNFPQAYLMLGMVYLEEKKWREAQSALNESLKLAPNSAAAYLALGAPRVRTMGADLALAAVPALARVVHRMVLGE